MKNTHDYVGKILLDSFIYSDVYNDRNTTESVIVDGREYYVNGQRTPITFVGNLYDISSNVEPFKTLLIIGIAKNRRNRNATYDECIEVAAFNAQISPSVVLEFNKENLKEIKDAFNDICEIYKNSFVDVSFEYTQEEIEKYGIYI